MKIEKIKIPYRVYIIIIYNNVIYIYFYINFTISNIKYIF